MICLNEISTFKKKETLHTVPIMNSRCFAIKWRRGDMCVLSSHIAQEQVMSSMTTVDLTLVYILNIFIPCSRAWGHEVWPHFVGMHLKLLYMYKHVCMYVCKMSVCWTRLTNEVKEKDHGCWDVINNNNNILPWIVK